MSEKVDFRRDEMTSEKNDLWFWETRRQMDDEEWRQLKNE